MNDVNIGICWCLAWGDGREPQFDISVLREMVDGLKGGGDVPAEVRDIVEQVREFEGISDDYFPQTLEKLKQLTKEYSILWKSKIGLVYGGATKIKQYVFEAAKLPDVRGASALLDKINLIDLPAFFGCEKDSKNYPQCGEFKEYCEEVREKWLNVPCNFPQLSTALIPELIIYSTGGNILAFCPTAFIDDLANAIEKRYTEETLIANSCAVGSTFKVLEVRFGLLPDKINEQTFWLDKYSQKLENPLVKSYFKTSKNGDYQQEFKDRKTFNELAGKLASLFNQRRNGNVIPGNDRPLRCYPPMFETHPYLMRDEGDRRYIVLKANDLPNQPKFSEVSARRRYVGQKAKRDDESLRWYEDSELDWKPGEIKTWVNRFDDFVDKENKDYYDKVTSERVYPDKVTPARSLRELGNVNNGFVAYVYADGNNMGGYIQKIKSPGEYQEFSRHISEATEESVYLALAQHLQPHKLQNLTDADNINRNGKWIHPFEILTIGGDDVMLIVPANKALDIAKTIGEECERILLSKGDIYKVEEKEQNKYNPQNVHRYQPKDHNFEKVQCKLSMSTGVLITAENTPIYYAQKLTEQLLKSAKKKAKDLKEDKKGYYGGTVDFLVMKSVTMISSNISEFRSNGLTKLSSQGQKLKLYAAPYTLHELDGLLKTAQALIDAEFPKSQLYQIRSLLEKGKQTAILNYRYFRVRLSDQKAQESLKNQFEESWCKPKEKGNNGNLAPWMTLKEEKEENEEDESKVIYETIWRELVDLYPFLEKTQKKSNSTTVKIKSKKS
jgi:CRISPR-associated protein Cmr2